MGKPRRLRPGQTHRGQRGLPDLWTGHASRARSVLATFYFRFPAECADVFVNKNAPNVTKVLAVAAISALSQVADGQQDVDGSALRFGVKWPNDIIVGGRKIGGILARAVPFNGRLEGI